MAFRLLNLVADRILGDRRVSSSMMLTEPFRQRLVEDLVRVANEALGDAGLSADALDPGNLAEIIADFMATYDERPVRDNRGGSGFHNCFWLYLITRIREPTLIVESGVWKGQSSWFLRRAAPGAEIHAFDVSFRRLVYRDPDTHYHERDWGGFDFGSVRGPSLCYFDCHVNQALRIRQAYEKGMRWLVFDDAAPADRLYLFGRPPAPTVPMLFDADIHQGDSLEWVTNGKRHRWDYSASDEHGARALIGAYHLLPDVGARTGWGGFSYLTLVRLRDRGDPTPGGLRPSQVDGSDSVKSPTA